MSRRMSTKTPWSTLGIAPGSSFDQIKRRFYELAKQTHPDTQRTKLLESSGASAGIGKPHRNEAEVCFLQARADGDARPAPVAGRLSVSPRWRAGRRCHDGNYAV